MVAKKGLGILIIISVVVTGVVGVTNFMSTNQPLINIQYTGDGTDNLPGALVVSASSEFSLSENPEGTYNIAKLIDEEQIFSFTAEDILGQSITKTVSITIIDDDIESPIIEITYNGGYTDGDPGEITVIASDLSNLSVDPSGKYPVDPTIVNEEQIFTFTATDNDKETPFDSLSTTQTFSVTLEDDDTDAPDLNITYSGSFTDADPGNVVVFASDISGLSIDPSGIYPIANLIGEEQIFIFEAVDNDEDRENDQISTTETFTIIIQDDDTANPLIDILYTGDYTDANPGKLIVNATDESGLQIDPSGGFYVENLIGIEQSFTFIAKDDDKDRPNDSILYSKTFDIMILDDDIEKPDINITYTGDYTDNNPGSIIVNASDDSGLLSDPSGIIYIPSELGTYSWIFSAVDNDNDRMDDSLETHLEYDAQIIDDDVGNPIIEWEYFGNYSTKNPGYIKVTASDFSGLSIDPSGIYFLTSDIGNQSFTFIARDADADRPNDSLESIIEVQIEIKGVSIKNLVIDLIEFGILKCSLLDEEYWGHKSSELKDSMISKLEQLTLMVEEESYSDAYNKILHDIKPKLTGLKMDENGDEWGNGIFNNPWIISTETQMEFENWADIVLNALKFL